MSLVDGPKVQFFLSVKFSTPHLPIKWVYNCTDTRYKSLYLVMMQTRLGVNHISNNGIGIDVINMFLICMECVRCTYEEIKCQYEGYEI